MNASTMAYQNQANTSNAKPVTDTLTISGVDAYQTTLTGVRFTLNYSTGSYGGTITHSTTKTANSVTTAKTGITAVKDEWTIHPTNDINLKGHNTTNERFRIQPRQPLETTITLHAKKHWEEGASKKNITDFQAQFIDDVTGKIY